MANGNRILQLLRINTYMHAYKEVSMYVITHKRKAYMFLYLNSAVLKMGR